MTIIHKFYKLLWATWNLSSFNN